jgi:hypothetical protein
MSKEILYLGLDVHAENIAVAIAEGGRDREVSNHRPRWSLGSCNMIFLTPSSHR